MRCRGSARSHFYDTGSPTHRKSACIAARVDVVHSLHLPGKGNALKKIGRFCCVNGAGSVAMLHHLVPERIPFQKPKNMYFGVETSVDETSLGQFVALYRACRTIKWHKLAHYFTQQPAFEPKFDQIRARVR